MKKRNRLIKVRIDRGDGDIVTVSLRVPRASAFVPYSSAIAEARAASNPEEAFRLACEFVADMMLPIVGEDGEEKVLSGEDMEDYFYPSQVWEMSGLIADRTAGAHLGKSSVIAPSDGAKATSATSATTPPVSPEDAP